MNKNLSMVFNGFDCGKVEMKPYVVMADGTCIYPQYNITVNDKAGNFSFVTKYENLFSDSLYFQYKKDEIVCRRLFENISGNELEIKELAVELTGITYGLNPDDDYFYHVENPRMFCKMTFPIDFDRTQYELNDENFDKTTYTSKTGDCWADPGVHFKRVGDSPYQTFPAVLVSNYNTKKGLVHGTLKQRPFYHNYGISHENGSIKFEIFSSFKSIGFMKMVSGKVLQDEWYLGKTDYADDIEKIFEGYTKVLRQKLPVTYGRTNINKDNMVWGSWNDGILRNVTEDIILTEAKYLKENFPTVKWIQLDDGYATYAGENDIAFGLGMAYEGDDGLDKNKFPEGLRSYADKIREIGLRPAIWVGGFCPKGTKIYQEHPEWFFDYSERVDTTAPLDVSKEEVREFMKSALDYLLAHSGFEGIKHDFWSYAFEDSNDLLANKNKSGYEHRDWWLKEIRKRIPADGYMQTGCDIVMANPFLGEFFTNYRYGEDIGAGSWDSVCKTYIWGMPCFALHIGDLFVPNSDSIGMLPGLNDDDAYFCINYCLATRSSVEISGILSKAEHNDRYKMLKKAACNPNNGQDIHFANYDYRANRYEKGVVPEIIYFNSPHFSVIENGENIPVRTVALFNLHENEKVLSFTPENLGLKNSNYVLTDVWSGEQYDLINKVEFAVKPHTSRLFAISKKKGIQLYDANIRVNSVEADENALIIENDYAAKEAEFYFSEKVKKIYVNDKEVPFNANGNTVTFDIEEVGKIKFEF